MNARAFQPVRIGVVGAGRFGSAHVRTLQGLTEAQCVAVVDRDRSAVEALVSDGSNATGYTDLDEAMASAGVDAWLVAVSTSAHVVVAEKLLSSGYPVLLEKPIAQSVGEAEKLAPLVADDSANLMLGHIMLFNSEIRVALAEVGRRGPFKFADFIQHRPAAHMDLFPGEHPFSLVMIHDLYLLQRFMGGREPSKCHALARRDSRGRCDLGLAELIWEDGTVARLSASFCCPPGMPEDGFDRIELFGEGWSLRLDPNPRPLMVWDERTRSPLALEICLDDPAPSGMLAEELRCFSRVVRGVVPVPVGARFQDGLQVMNWIDRLKAEAGMD